MAALVDFLFPAIVTLWLAASATSVIGISIYRNRLDFKPRVSIRPAIAVIIPVRGASVNLSRLWNALREQTYPKFRVLFAVESEHDPAHQALKSLVARSRRPPGEIVVAGLTRDEGQKVHNQRAAMAALRPSDAIVVFADADIMPTPQWLDEVADLLATRSAMIVSGYRWMLPGDRRLSTAFACIINDSIAAQPRLSALSLAWGGTMAAWRETLERIDAKGTLKGSLNDDLQLTRAVNDAGGVVETPPHMLLRTSVRFRWPELIEFGRRQYIQIRIYAPEFWALAAFATALPLLGWMITVPLALAGDLRSMMVLAAAIALHQTRVSLRLAIPRKLWGMEQDRAVVLLERAAAPITGVIHAALVWSTMFARTLRWGDRIYRIDGPRQVRIVKRDRRA
jgi:hypothetical protein